jgi:hypothetical protein
MVSATPALDVTMASTFRRYAIPCVAAYDCDVLSVRVKLFAFHDPTYVYPVESCRSTVYVAVMPVVPVLPVIVPEHTACPFENVMASVALLTFVHNGSIPEA